jgi:hypothetical protein
LDEVALHVMLILGVLFLGFLHASETAMAGVGGRTMRKAANAGFSALSLATSEMAFSKLFTYST